MRKIFAIALALALTATLFAGCSATAKNGSTGPVQTNAGAIHTAASQTASDQTIKAPKYVFLFIGDGMSFPQFQSAADYLGAMADSDYMQAVPSLDDNQGAVLDGPKPLNFMGFETVGSVVTYDSNSFAPDSASTATSIATGYKTYSGSINVDETATKVYETITEKVHEQLGMKVGIISSVNLNHATPAAFYAHQASRNSYYEIGLELIDSGFEYFAGGGLKKPTGADKDKEDLYALAKQAGYNVVKTQAEADKITSGPVIIIAERLTPWALADYVEKGIEVLDNDKGFFMMCEGGKIDWACHANDAASTIHDTLALADAVQVAIGFAGTDYDTYLSLLDSQKISFAKFDSDYVAAYKENKTDFNTVLADIEKLFGLKAKGDTGASFESSRRSMWPTEPTSR